MKLIIISGFLASSTVMAAQHYTASRIPNNLNCEIEGGKIVERLQTVSSVVVKKFECRPDSMDYEGIDETSVYVTYEGSPLEVTTTFANRQPWSIGNFKTQTECQNELSSLTSRYEEATGRNVIASYCIAPKFKFDRIGGYTDKQNPWRVKIDAVGTPKEREWNRFESFFAQKQDPDRSTDESIKDDIVKNSSNVPSLKIEAINYDAAGTALDYTVNVGTGAVHEIDWSGERTYSTFGAAPRVAPQFDSLVECESERPYLAAVLSSAGATFLGSSCQSIVTDTFGNKAHVYAGIYFAPSKITAGIVDRKFESYNACTNERANLADRVGVKSIACTKIASVVGNRFLNGFYGVYFR